jgi:hypothetical protein
MGAPNGAPVAPPSTISSMAVMPDKNRLSELLEVPVKQWDRAKLAGRWNAWLDQVSGCPSSIHAPSLVGPPGSTPGVVPPA